MQRLEMAVFEGYTYYRCKCGKCGQVVLIRDACNEGKKSVHIDYISHNEAMNLLASLKKVYKYYPIYSYKKD